MGFYIISGDITKQNTDAIVNAANTELLPGGGVCGAIYKAAGPNLLAATESMASIKTGEAVITKGFDLPAKYIIHAAGPIWHGGSVGEKALLYAAYANSLKVAKENHVSSIAFPLISSGIYGYPKVAAYEVAKEAITDFLKQNDMAIYLVLFGTKDLPFGEPQAIKTYIEKHLVTTNYGRDEEILQIQNIKDAKEKEEMINAREEALQYSTFEQASPLPPKKRKKLASKKTAGLVNEPALSPSADFQDFSLADSFSVALIKRIDQDNHTDVEIYKKANMDRKLFNKIKNNKDYQPKKITAVALVLALELSLRDSQDLLQRAGYALSPSSLFDVIIRYFIEHEIYDIYQVNQVLFEYQQPLLGI